MFAGLAYAENPRRRLVSRPIPPQTEPGAPTSAQPSGGMLGTIGKIIDQSISTVGSGVSAVGAGVSAGVKGAGDTLGATTEAAGDVAKGVTDTGRNGRPASDQCGRGHERARRRRTGRPDCEGASVAAVPVEGVSRGAQRRHHLAAFKCPASDVAARGARRPT